MNQTLTREQQIVAAVRKITRAVDLHSKRLVEVFGLTGPQLATLQEAGRLGPTSASTIARAVHLSQATVTGILTRLERRALITRSRSEADRREIVVSVTDKAEKVLDEAPSLLQDRFRHKLERLEEWERLLILSTLERIATLMGAEQIDAAPHLITDSVNLPAGAEPAVYAQQAAPSDVLSNASRQETGRTPAGSRSSAAPDESSSSARSRSST